MTKDTMRILKTATCQSLSGRSTLTYKIGCNDGKEVGLFIESNSGQGKFSKDWIFLDSIMAIEKKPITSGSLQVLFKNKSSNTAGFILAVLLAEGLLKVSEGNARHYERVDQKEYEKIIQGDIKKKTGKKGVTP